MSSSEPRIFVSQSTIYFPTPLESDVVNVVVIRNLESQKVAFKIRTSIRDRYTVKPTVRVLHPKEECQVRITFLHASLQLPGAAVPNEKTSDRFTIEAVFAESDADPATLFKPPASSVSPSSTASGAPPPSGTRMLLASRFVPAASMPGSMVVEAKTATTPRPGTVAPAAIAGAAGAAASAAAAMAAATTVSTSVTSNATTAASSVAVTAPKVAAGAATSAGAAASASASIASAAAQSAPARAAEAVSVAASAARGVSTIAADATATAASATSKLGGHSPPPSPKEAPAAVEPLMAPAPEANDSFLMRLLLAKVPTLIAAVLIIASFLCPFLEHAYPHLALRH